MEEAKHQNWLNNASAEKLEAELRALKEEGYRGAGKKKETAL